MPITSLLVLLLAGTSISPAAAEIRSFDRNYEDPITPIDEFGFAAGGVLQLNVSKIEISETYGGSYLSRLGFFLATQEAWLSAILQMAGKKEACALEQPAVDIVYQFDRLTRKSADDPFSFSVVLPVKNPGLYTLFFANCLPKVQVSMEIISAMYNNDSITGERDYLSAGVAVLPQIYFFFFLVYAGLTGLWIFVLYKKRLSAFRIHYLMLALVALKAINLACKAEEKSYIRRTGSPHGWDVPFYIFSLLKGIMLFTLIVLIGTGWSFLKPYLQDKEKKVLMVVIPLQVIANVAQVILDEGPYATNDYMTWKEVFLLVDIVCCCAVLFPIVWSIRKLREAARTDGKAAVNLMKLTLFRKYYIVVICYIYFTRIGVYAISVMVSYRYMWTAEVARELATLAFFVFTGYNFRPEAYNPYFAIDDEEEEAAAEALKLDDEFEL